MDIKTKNIKRLIQYCDNIHRLKIDEQNSFEKTLKKAKKEVKEIETLRRK